MNFHAKRQEYIRAGNSNTDFKTVSKKELLELRSKVIHKRRISSLKSWLITLIIIVPIIYLGAEISSVFMNRAVKEVEESEIQKQMLLEQGKQDSRTEKLNKYNFLLKDGDKWFRKGNFKNAIHQYENAVDLFPTKYDANYKLATTYLKTCEEENEGCVIGSGIGEKLLDLFPNDDSVVKLNENFELVTAANNGYEQ